jgi:N6-adenosine-specific RNA methylase IME4
MRYGVIVADPPWKTMGGPLMGGSVGEGWHWKDQTKGATRPLPYSTMTVEQIAALPVASLADDDCALYLWTINAYVEDAYAIARAWGFKPSTLLTWCKAPMGGGLGGVHGISTEFVLYARNGSPAEKRTPGTWFEGEPDEGHGFGWKRFYVNGKPAHSAKPEAFYDKVHEATPEGPYVELFARRARLGWDYWGNESLGTAEMAS